MAEKNAKTAVSEKRKPSDEEAPEGAPAGTAAERGDDDEGEGGGVAPKFNAQASVLPPDPVEEGVMAFVQKVRQNAQPLAAGGLLLLVIVLGANWKIEGNRARNRQAWEEMRRLVEAPSELPPGVTWKGPEKDKILALADAYAGTDAEPFLRLRAADKDYEAGDKASLEKAAAAYEQVARDFARNPVARDLAVRSLEATKKSLAFDPAKVAAEKGERVEWAAGESANGPSTSTSSMSGASAAPAPK